MAEDPKSVGDILDRLEELANEDDKVSLGDVVEALGNRSQGPFLLVPALVEISPLGGIPGFPTAIALVIVLIAVQIVLGRKHLWLPKFLSNRALSSEKVCKATGKLRGLARFMDRWFHGRLPALTKGPFVRVAAGACILLACTVPPLELLPFATTAPMAAIAAFGLALLVRDGLLMIVAMVLTLVAVGVGVGMLGSGGAQ
ncbi:exopolysaccharide biosynthesis protein [Sphingomonas sp. IC-56]|uniref:exopolysaccharide biosynthesis protein n=1 Tax=Sphingomonas sp. IC-56 TaxID=2898529 RepID=UPI001E602279|nr:exopolysaccharide biosynthesis protein [Sphingomonas sp. IC-56]MCD2325268.1 exopolysaccharide biosynthesis protein [Sphingomonas sp. IC-56]